MNAADRILSPRRFVCCALAFIALASAADAQPADVPAPGANPPTAADRAFAALGAAKNATAPADLKQDPAARLRWMDAHRQALHRCALDLYAAWPNDPRRWDAALVIYGGGYEPLFIKEIGPDFATKGWNAIVFDEAAKAEYQAKVSEIRSIMDNASDLPHIPREVVEWARFAADFRATTEARQNGKPGDYGGFRARFDAHVAKYQDLDETLVARASDYLLALSQEDLAAACAGWAHLVAHSPNAAVKDLAKTKWAQMEHFTRPLELKFTAADGREVDLAQLRGKVVLIDFWATWCGPCKEELPNVKKVYADYHAKGFEVVGITLENAKLSPQDTAEQAAAKLAKARNVLMDFTAKENMPWPQYFDGKFWQSEIAKTYDIKGIPAMFLLDREGRIVATDARGEKLEAEVKRLLSL